MILDDKFWEEFQNQKLVSRRRNIISTLHGCIDERIQNSVFSRKDLGIERLEIIDHAEGRDGHDPFVIHRSLNRAKKEETIPKFLRQLDALIYWRWLKLQKYIGIHIGEIDFGRLYAWKESWKEAMGLLNPGGLYWIKDGIYSIPVQIDVNKENVLLQGAGPSAIVKLTSLYMHGVVITAAYSACEIFTIDGNCGSQHAGDSESYRGLQVESTYNVRLNRLNVINCYSRGLEIDNSTRVFGSQLYFENCHRGLMTWNTSMPANPQSILIEQLITKDIVENSIDFGISNGEIIDGFAFRNTACGVVPDASKNLLFMNGEVDSSASIVEVVNGFGNVEFVIAMNVRGKGHFAAKSLSANGYSMNDVYFIDCISTSSGWHNFVGELSQTGTLKRIHFINCWGNNPASGKSNFEVEKITGATNRPTEIHFQGCRGYNASWCGFEGKNVDKIYFDGCYAELPGHEGIALYDCQMGHIIGCIVKNAAVTSAYSGIYGKDSKYFSVIGCQAFDNRTPKLQPYGLKTGPAPDTSDYWYVIGNDFRDNLYENIVLVGTHNVRVGNMGEPDTGTYELIPGLPVAT